MSRVKLELPGDFSFQCTIPVRITDLNYGGHAGNDTILSLIHEARMQFLHHFGYTEMNMEGTGMIMADAALEFKSELFYPETIRVSVTAGDCSRIGFNLYYKLERTESVGERPLLIAVARTAMICYDYERKRIVSLSIKAKEKLERG
jgi:acyl-CoA thioesterase FadM